VGGGWAHGVADGVAVVYWLWYRWIEGIKALILILNGCVFDFFWPSCGGFGGPLIFLKKKKKKKNRVVCRLRG
jgi:hypothetical protein